MEQNQKALIIQMMQEDERNGLYTEENKNFSENKYVRWKWLEETNSWCLYNDVICGDVMYFNRDIYSLPEALIVFNKEVYNYEYYGK